MWLLLACAASNGSPADSVTPTGDDTATPTDPRASPGCGQAVDLAPGGVQRTLDAGAEGGGTRGYWLSLPEGYDPDQPHALVLGYPGTDWVGEQIQPYLDLERHADGDVIFAYPDPLWREFEGWGTYGGWTLGPWADPADGMEDLVFTEQLLDTLAAELCVDPARVFVTGHSWGGDMAAVVACFLGERVRAAIPVAANRPYWFEPDDGSAMVCPGAPAVWTFFGEADDHFTWQDHPGQFGEEQDAFWADAHACGAGTVDLGLDDVGGCIEHEGCTTPTRYCLYGPETAHQVPRRYDVVAMEWFLGFE